MSEQEDEQELVIQSHVAWLRTGHRDVPWSCCQWIVTVRGACATDWRRRIL